MNDEHYYKQAMKTVKKKKEFRSNAFAFTVVMPFLIFINLWTSPGYLWFLWPLLGWGMGLAFQYYDAFVQSEKNSWEDHEVQKEMERMRMRDRRFLNGEKRRDELDERMDLRELRRDYDERDLV